MALDFPSSPILNQIITSEGLKYIWNGTAWVGYSSEISYSQADFTDIDAGDIFVTGITTSANLDVTNGQIDFLTGTNINISGVSTISNVVVGGATTELLVDGDVRITGILTIGTSSITLDGTNNQITIGAGTTIDSSGGANYAGVITAQGFSGNGAGLINIPTSQWIDVNDGIGVTSIYAAGNVGVATTNPSATFQVGGNPQEGNDGVGISSSGNINSSGIITATSFVKSSGTSSQFLKADGSVDSNTYLTSYTETDTLDSVTTRGNATSNGLFVGVVTATSLIKSGGTSSQFLKADGSVDSNTYLTSYTETDTLDSVTTRGSTTSNNVSVGIITATSFVRSGGTSGQFLKADGSVDSNTYTTYPGQWEQNGVGIHTLSSVGIGTTNPTEKLTVKGDVGVGGTLTIQQTTEVLNTKTGAGNTVTHDFSTGSIWYHSGISTDFTLNLTNVPTTENRSITVTLFLDQGATGYYANGLEVDGVTQTIKWANNATPIPSTNKLDVQSFTLIRTNPGTGVTWITLGQLINYN